MEKTRYGVVTSATPGITNAERVENAEKMKYVKETFIEHLDDTTLESVDEETTGNKARMLTFSILFLFR